MFEWRCSVGRPRHIGRLQAPQSTIYLRQSHVVATTSAEFEAENCIVEFFSTTIQSQESSLALAAPLSRRPDAVMKALQEQARNPPVEPPVVGAAEQGAPPAAAVTYHSGGLPAPFASSVAVQGYASHAYATTGVNWQQAYSASVSSQHASIDAAFADPARVEQFCSSVMRPKVVSLVHNWPPITPIPRSLTRLATCDFRKRATPSAKATGASRVLTMSGLMGWPALTYFLRRWWRLLRSWHAKYCTTALYS
jgi:hypothetical protein